MTGRTMVLSAASAAIVAAGACWVGRSVEADAPTATASRGSFVDALQVRGEIKAGRSITILAPPDAGELRIVKLVPSGTLVKKGDVLIEFDGSTVARTLEEKLTEVRQLDAEIEQARFESRGKNEENVTAVTKARYDVERAKLDYSAREVLSRVEAEQRALKIGDAEQLLLEASARLESDRAAAQARIAGLNGKRAKAQFDLDKARRQLNSLTVAAPSDGIVTILRNWRSGNWMNPQDFKEGDRVWAGASIAELPDLGSLFASARVDEVERGRLAVGQPAAIRVEAMLDRELDGRIGGISALAKADFTSWPPPRNFDLVVDLQATDERLRPGMTATIRVATETLADVVLVPPQSVFQADGEDVVYVIRRGRPERRRIAVDRRNADHVVVREGVEAGEQLALEDPTAATEARR